MKGAPLFLPYACGVALMLLCGSCTQKQDVKNSAPGTGIDTAAVLRYRLAGDPPTLDIAHSTDTQSAAVLLKIFDGLVQFNPATLTIEPAVARSWEISANGRTYTFRLRSNVYFHNNEKVTAAHFASSFERVLNPKTASERLWVLMPIKGAQEYNSGKAGTVTGIRATDDSTLSLELERPFSPFLSQLCMEAASVMPRSAVLKGNEYVSSHPVGCGPFKMAAWKRGSEITLERFGEYYGTRPKFSRIVYKLIPNVEVAYQQYLAGDLDFLDEVGQGKMELLQKQRPAELKKWPVLGIYYFGFNLDKPPFKGNTNLRRALCCAVNRADICKVIFEGNALPARGILPPGIEGYDSGAIGYEYNVPKAKELLAKAGYPNGRGLPPITLWYNQNERHHRVAQYLQALFANVGVVLTLKELEWGTYLEALQKGEPELFRLGWVADLPDADNFLYPLLHSSQIGAGDNFSHFRNAAFDSLINAARAGSRRSGSVALYAQADSLAMAEAPWIMISYSVDACLVKPEWRGVELSRQGVFAIPLEYMYKIR